MTDGLLAIARRAYDAQAAGRPLTVSHSEYDLLKHMDKAEWDEAVQVAWREHDDIAYNLSPLMVEVAATPG